MQSGRRASALRRRESGASQRDFTRPIHLRAEETRQTAGTKAPASARSQIRLRRLPDEAITGPT